jgi:hypothetical protein
MLFVRFSRLNHLRLESLADRFAEKLLEILCDQDYDDMIELLKPEMEKAKRCASGKHLMSVCSNSVLVVA